MAEGEDPSPEPAEPDFDENGVDLAQIRHMLALTPEERLRFVEDLADSIDHIRALNGLPPLR